MFQTFIKGYMTVKVSGLGKERLITICGKRNILIWDMKYESDSVIFSILAKDYKFFSALLQKTATEAVLVEKHGLPFLMPVLKKKTELILGFLFGFVFVTILQCFVWSIKIEGNEAVTKNQFEQMLLKENITIPLLGSKLDSVYLKNEILSSFEDISWVSIDKTGCSLNIRVKEKEEVVTPPEKMVQRKDVFAKDAGEVVSIITRSGIPNVKVGDHVEAGDLLVSGQIPILAEDGTIKSVNECIADADILIESKVCKHIYIPLVYKNKQYTKQKKYPWICIFGKEISLIPYLNADENRELIKEYACNNRLNRMSKAICFGHYVVNWYDYQLISYTDQEKNEMIEEKTNYLIRRMNEKNITIKQKNVTIQKNDKNWDIIVNFQILTKQ